MAPDNSDSNVISRPGSRPDGAPQSGGGIAAVVDKYRSLPRPAQIAIAVGVCVLLYMVLGNRSQPAQQRVGNINMGVMNGRQVSPTFTGIETDRPALMQSVFEQNRRDMADLRNEVRTYFTEQKVQKAESDAKTDEQQRRMQQMMDDFTTEIKSIQDERMRDSERLGQLAQQQQQLELNAPTDGSTGINSMGNRRRQITQVTLGGGVGQALAGPLGRSFQNRGHFDSSGRFVSQEVGAEARLPFIPPLGFVRGTLLNGVDALTGGTPTPSLVRLSGSYRTAMNSTVVLDGCFALVQFNGNISTERAIGNPSRMTCVYPDGGAATYNIGGYVVDAEDGIIGVPGVLYEGDPTRIAAAVLADFAAGVGEIIEQNQTTNTVDSDGTQRSTFTGSQARAQVAGGLNKSMSTLRDYLKERVDRVQSFIRLDATREINLVILTGTELRHEGNPWTMLFDAASAESAGATGATIQAQQNQQPPQ